MQGALAAGCAFGTAGTSLAHAVQYPIGAVTSIRRMALASRQSCALCHELQPRYSQ